jgi:hypothetical protein
MTHLAGLLAQIPDPGHGKPPPGVSEKVLTLLQWGTWIALVCCVAGFIICAGKLAIARTEGGGDAGGGVVRVMAACILVGSAAGIVRLLI